MGKVGPKWVGLMVLVLPVWLRLESYTYRVYFWLVEYISDRSIKAANKSILRHQRGATINFWILSHNYLPSTYKNRSKGLYGARFV